MTSEVGIYAVGHPDAGEDFAVLKSINANEDILLESNGTGVVKVIGDFSVRADVGTRAESLLEEPVFRVLSDGQIRMLVPLADTASGAFEIIGNDTGIKFSPNQTGVILHITGNSGLVCRNYFDANDNYALIVGRRYNGTVDSTTPVLSGQSMLRIAAQGILDDGTFGSFGVGRLDWVATQDQAPNAQGGELRVYAVANNQPGTNATLVATFNATTGVVSDVGFVGDLTGNVSGSAGSVVNALTAGTYLTSGGTYNGSTARTFAVDATTAATASKVVARDSNGDIAARRFTGKHVRTVRDAGVIADGGTLTIDFSTDAIVMCEWGNGFTVAYSNYTAGSVVKLLAYKTAGTGTDSLSLNGITAAHVSSGSTTVSSTADLTTFVEFTCTGTTIGSVYAKV